MKEDLLKKAAAQRAMEYVKDDMMLGLGSGSTVYYVLHALHERIRKGLQIQVVCSSVETKRLARQLQIPILHEDTSVSLDLNIDGVDQIDEAGDVIKGGGAALTREKILAQWAKHTIWVMDDRKVVDALEPYLLPVEILPFCFEHMQHTLEELGYQTSIRMQKEKRLVTDNGNHILDVIVPSHKSMRQAHEQLLYMAGVVETGYFHNIPARAVIASQQGITIRDHGF